MIAENNVQNVETLEEYTLFSLDRSPDGLQAMLREARYCGDALRSGTAEMQKVKTLVEHLHGFNMFEINMSTVFGLDRTRCADALGSFETAMADYRQALTDFGSCLARNDPVGAGCVLKDNMGAALARIGELIPSVRTLIAREYGDKVGASSAESMDR